MICKEANVNVAMVNYYFRSKSELYKKVVVSLFENISAPLNGIYAGVKDEETWRNAIRKFIRWGLDLCAAVEPPAAYIARLMGLEASLPSSMAKEINNQVGQPMRRNFNELMKMGMENPTDEELNLWFSSIHAQCVVYAIGYPLWMDRYCPPEMAPSTWLCKVCDHICQDIFTRLHYRERPAKK